ncbi:hypothetical protein [Actinomadura litoris]|uniref:hypothetical protein n=1 Tax=Actinomadura litoris TaxID=2678616 RepID=UPI001FA6E35D|nr:hypothetical protein [Actinomadura litoris]
MDLPTIQSNLEGASERAVATVFTGTATFVTHGQVILNATSGSFTPNTRVTASIVELDANGVPFIGAARLTIHNVQPYQGGVRVWANIEWGSNLRVRVSYLWET